ncbi:hypothetical protein C5D35_07075 [Rathayibacter toxicus]|nr:hypothetical protein C5D35_07075 [Rathayibacter toxicus]
MVIGGGALIATGVSGPVGGMLIAVGARVATAAGTALAHGAGTALNNIKSALSTKTTHTATTALEDIQPTPQYVNLASKERTKHVLDGELLKSGKWGGGHFWPDKPGKTVFPKDRSDEKIMHYISDIATDPKIPWIPQHPNIVENFTKKGKPVRFSTTGVREWVTIKVIVEPPGEGIITGYPVSYK